VKNPGNFYSPPGGGEIIFSKRTPRKFEKNPSCEGKPPALKALGETQQGGEKKKCGVHPQKDRIRKNPPQGGL